ncbi:MAG: hypothetical protein QM765_38695 [Myxococcales bacterium]
MNTKVTEERQTPKSDFGARMKDGLATAASAVATGVGVAAPLVPGGAIISAAVNGVGTLSNSLSSGQRAGVGGGGRAIGGTGSMPSTGTTSGSGSSSNVTNIPSQGYTEGMDLLAAQQNSNMSFLTLQNQMQQENQKFSTLSNVIKVRHDTAKNSISNIR